MTTIILAPGDKLAIQLSELDGEFEVHFDTIECPRQIVIKETGGRPGSEVGGAYTILYCDTFGLPVGAEAGGHFDKDAL